jgi:universal stress protein A
MHARPGSARRLGKSYTSAPQGDLRRIGKPRDAAARCGLLLAPALQSIAQYRSRPERDRLSRVPGLFESGVQTMNFKRILFATDFSPASETALTYATSLARDSGAVLVIAHVEELPLPYAGGEMYIAQPEYPNPEIRKMLENVVPPDSSVRFEHKLVMGTAADDVVRIADEEHADLIVIGTHGRTGLMRVLMGSVAESIMRLAQCPVLTVKQAHKPS